MPRSRTCDCGSCPKCKNREANNRFYRSKSMDERRALMARRDREKIRLRDRVRNVKRAADPVERAKAKTRWTTRNAIRDGRLERQPCEKCGVSNAQAHHDDYTKPFAVRWLCSVHHAQEHS